MNIGIFCTDTAWHATTNNATNNKRYNEQLLSKSGCYNERAGMLSADTARARMTCQVFPL
jgi:hypothetical protein